MKKIFKLVSTFSSPEYHAFQDQFKPTYSTQDTFYSKIILLKRFTETDPKRFKQCTQAALFIPQYQVMT